jgi:probable phosphoglycerate mutase
MAPNILIYIMRHGRTEWNYCGKLQGRMNSPLLQDSYKQLRNIGRFLIRQEISHVYSSPLERCRLSADLVSQIIGIKPVYLDALMECDHGKCEGLSLVDAKNTFPEFFYSRETGDKWNIKWPGGESYADVMTRADRALSGMDLSSTTLIIGHETVNKVLLGLLLGLTHEEIMRNKQKNSEIFRFETKTRLFSVIPL